MQQQQSIQVFDDIFATLQQPGALTGPAEVHGALTGLICIEHKFSSRVWFDTVLKVLESRARIVPQQRNVMIGLYDITCRSLHNEESDFQLLLPNDKYTYADRAVALSHWCRGYIYGLSFISDSIEEELCEESQRALKSISDIAQLNFGEIEVGEADKAAYFNVVDYVRTTIMNLYDELTYDHLSAGALRKKVSLFH